MLAKSVKSVFDQIDEINKNHVSDLSYVEPEHIVQESDFSEITSKESVIVLSEPSLDQKVQVGDPYFYYYNISKPGSIITSIKLVKVEDKKYIKYADLTNVSTSVIESVTNNTWHILQLLYNTEESEFPYNSIQRKAFVEQEECMLYWHLTLYATKDIAIIVDYETRTVPFCNQLKRYNHYLDAVSRTVDVNDTNTTNTDYYIPLIQKYRERRIAYLIIHNKNIKFIEEFTIMYGETKLVYPIKSLEMIGDDWAVIPFTPSVKDYRSYTIPIISWNAKNYTPLALRIKKLNKVKITTLNVTYVFSTITVRCSLHGSIIISPYSK